MKYESVIAACIDCTLVADDLTAVIDVLKRSESGSKILRTLAVDIVAVLKWCDSVEQIAKYSSTYESASNREEILEDFTENVKRMQDIIAKAYYYTGSNA